MGGVVVGESDIFLKIHCVYKDFEFICKIMLNMRYN